MSTALTLTDSVVSSSMSLDVVINDPSDISKAIKSIKSRGARLDNDIWIAAVSAMLNHSSFGSTNLLNDLVAAMPQGSRVNALRTFITAFGAVKWHNKKGIFVHDKQGSFDLEGAMSISWVEFKPEPDYKPIDAIALIKALIKKVDAADPAKGDKVTSMQVSELHDMARKLGAI